MALGLIAVAAALNVIALIFLLAHQRTTGVLSLPARGCNGLILARNEHIVSNAFIYGTMLEELLEMSGVAVAFASLLSLFQHDARHGTLRLDPALLPPSAHREDPAALR